MLKNILTVVKKGFYLIIGLTILIFILGFLSAKMFVKELTMSCKGIESHISTNKKDEVSSNKSEKIISLSITLYEYPFLKPSAHIDSGWGDYYFDAKDESRSVFVFPHSLIANSRSNDGRYSSFNLDRISRVISMERTYDKEYDKRPNSQTLYTSSEKTFEGICEDRKPL